ncbi:MAG TPA: amidase [Candidatus Acidoferrum sp.]|jgi:aspartyl-tRNA(Asn)/glutamyl-tRNA(Gln) amidotransferase subunit A|nr:amidase [Candidatus Acidoferrum sp.]
MSDTDLAFASIEEIGKLFRKRKLSPVDLTRLMLARIEQLNPKLNAFITVTADLALAQAEKAERELFAARGRKGHRDRGPLHGIPISLKDNIYTAGIRTTAGSKILQDFVPKEDAGVVVQLRQAGAIILGKTNMHEFAYGVTSNNPHYGPVRNPWDLSRIAGGSSGGSAAAVAAGLCYGTIGTDTGGSIRIPAALCGVVGLKPHYRRVSTAGVVPLSVTLDHVGPLARSVVDVALLLRAVTAGGYLDGTVEKAPWAFKFSGTSEIQRKPTTPVHLGIPVDYFWNRLDEQVRKVLMHALNDGKNSGVVLHEYRVPAVDSWTEPSTNIALAEATDFHQRSGWYPARATDYGEDVRARLELGREIRATDYLAALSKRRMAWLTLFDHRSFPGLLNAVVAPTTPFATPEIGAEEVPVDGQIEKVRAGLLRLNRPANFAELPAISVPCGFSSSGLPIGLQIIGWGWQELSLLRIAHAFEKAHDGHLRRPPL